MQGHCFLKSDGKFVENKSSEFTEDSTETILIKFIAYVAKQNKYKNANIGVMADFLGGRWTHYKWNVNLQYYKWLLL